MVGSGVRRGGGGVMGVGRVGGGGMESSCTIVEARDVEEGVVRSCVYGVEASGHPLHEAEGRRSSESLEITSSKGRADGTE